MLFCQAVKLSVCVVFLKPIKKIKDSKALIYVYAGTFTKMYTL